MMKNSLRLKLIFFIFSSILLTLTIVGFAFDRLLDKQYQQKAGTEITHSYDSIKNQIKTFEESIIDKAHQVATDESVIATTNLINRYQNTTDYQAIIFDSEKKKTAYYLLQQIIATPSDIAILHDQNGELIAFAVQDEHRRTLGITSYQDGRRIILGEDYKTGGWLPIPLPDKVMATLLTLDDEAWLQSHPGTLQYISNNNDITLKNTHSIQRNHQNQTSETIGYVTLLKPIGLPFLNAALSKTDTSISLLLANGNILNQIPKLLPLTNLLRHSQPMGSTTLKNMMWLEHATYYLQSYVIPTTSGEAYLFITLPKNDLNSALNQTRMTLLIILIFTAIIVTIFGMYWLNQLVSNPLHLLIQHARKVENGETSTLPARQSNDEIGQLTLVLNSMAAAVKERENELTNTQQTLKEAQHIAKIGSWVREYTTGKLVWSDEVYNILNLKPETTNPYPEVFINAIHPDDRERVQQVRFDAHQNRGRCDFNYRLQLDDGKIKHIHERCTFKFAKDGNLISSSGTIQDITEQHDKDEIVRRSQKMDALGQLTGGIAHDFNNMLGVILGFSELMTARVADDEKLTKYITNIHHAAERAKNMTSKLLAFSRMKPVSQEITNISELLHEQKHMLEKSLTARIELVFETSDALWPVYIERGGLEDAILNMSINAMHAMPDRGQLMLRTRNTHLSPVDASSFGISEGDYVLLSIVDTGSGMSEETLEHLFDPFYSTKGTEGTGLGMSQVYAFVRQSGGVIKASSKQGYGTHLDIYIPRHSGASNLPVEHEDEIDIIDLTGFETILIVDDEEGVRNFEIEALSSYGYRVLSADSGEQALEVLARGHVDLLISDVIMPGMDGYQLAVNVKELYPNTTIVLASGYTEQRNKQLVTNLLHSSTLQKPFTLESLLKRVRESLDSSLNKSELTRTVNWCDEYKTGIDEIDRDHQVLISLIARCQQLVKHNGEANNIAEVLNELLEYADYHFQREELLMDICDYPDIAEHKKVHQQLIQQIQNHVSQYGNGTLTAQSLLSLLTRWLLSHIMGMDKTITPYCEGKEEYIKKSLSN